MHAPARSTCTAWPAASTCSSSSTPSTPSTPAHRSSSPTMARERRDPALLACPAGCLFPPACRPGLPPAAWGAVPQPPAPAPGTAFPTADPCNCSEFHFLKFMGPQVALLGLDMRSQRSKDRVMPKVRPNRPLLPLGFHRGRRWMWGASVRLQGLRPVCCNSPGEREPQGWPAVQPHASASQPAVPANASAKWSRLCHAPTCRQPTSCSAARWRRCQRARCTW